MRGLLTCCKWEVWRLGVLEPVKLLCFFLWLALSYSAARNWNGNGSPLVLALPLLAITALAAVQAARWAFSEAFLLERTSARAAWQSVGGRVLCWAALTSVGTGLFQVLLRVAVDQSRGWDEVREGMFDPQALAGWLGPWSFLGIWAAALGACVLALTLSLWFKSDRNRRQVNLGDSLILLLCFTSLFRPLWGAGPAGMGGVGAACLLAGLPLSCWLLEHRAE